MLLEEPELSLHPEVVRHVPQLLRGVARRRGRQTILSTHSTDLFLGEGISSNEILILTPQREGTSVRPASGIRQIRELRDAGATLMDAILPHTRPPDAQQLALFD